MPNLLEPVAPPGDLDSDSDALPEVGELISEEQKRQDQAHIQKALLERKKKLLLAQQTTKPAVSDDDLEIVPARDMQAVVKEEEAERKSGKKKRISEGRKRQLNHGGVGLERQRAKATPSKDEVLPFVVSNVGKLKGKTDSAIITQGELNRTLVQRVVSANKELTKKKEEEWVRKGGKVIEGTEGVSSSANDASTAYAEKGLQAAKERGVAMEVDDSEDEGSDEDWTPGMRGSTSPSPQPDDGEADEENQGDQEADITMVNPESEVLAVGDEFDEEVLKIRSRRRVQAIVDSDSDGGNNENTFPMPKLKPRAFGSPQDRNNENVILSIPLPSMNHRGSLSSTDERTEDENDKENNTSLMFDRSEDKENKAVVRHGDTGAKHPLGTRTSSLFQHETARNMSMSPVLQSYDIDADDEDNENEEGRSPLKELLDDPFASPVRSSTSFAARLQQASPAATLSAVANLANFIEKDSGYPQSPGGFGGELLQPGFSDLFESGTEKQKSTPFKRPTGRLCLSESFTDEVRTKKPLLTGS
jgi:mediator of replication checkpoint protein 1